MREEIYQWMKNLAVYYIFLTAVMNFVPDEKYARYIRYFTGMLLIVMLCSPLLALFRLDTSFLENFYRQAREAQAGMVARGEKEQQEYLIQGYEREVAAQIALDLRELGVTPKEVKVHLTGEELSISQVVLYLEDAVSGVGEEVIAGELEEKYGIGREALFFYYIPAGEESVDASAVGGTSAGGDRHAHEEK